MQIKYLSLLIFLSISGCALTPTHDANVSASLTSAAQGNVGMAIAQIDAKIQSGDKQDFLLNLEKAELLHLANQYKDSQAAFAIADSRVNIWEATAKSEPNKLLGNIGATIIGDKSRTYEGQDYEKVMLTTRMAMNNIALNDLDTARVDIKRTHEREATISQFRAKETFEAEKAAKEKGVTSSTKELDGYPIETLNDPDVLALKNGYQNALSHYLAGFVYEALNESGLAAPGYRQAIELRPGLPLLEEGLAGLDKRSSYNRKKTMTDVLFIVETGNAPARQSKKITLPIPTARGIITASFAYPVIYPDRDAMSINKIAFGDQLIPAALVADFNVMARRSLKDEMPGIQLRSVIRAVGKAAIQDQLNKQGGIAGLIGNIAAVATESPADDRMWRGLPGRVFIARSFVTPGIYQLRFSEFGPETLAVKVDGRYMVVPVRLYNGKAYFGDPVSFGTIDSVPAVVETKSSKPITEIKPVPKKTKKVIKVQAE